MLNLPSNGLARRPGALFATALLLSLGVYLASLAPDLSWANAGSDGGELITASVTLGVPHPPGYPSYVLLGKLFSLLPVGTVAYRFNLFSATCTAAATGLVALTIRHSVACRTQGLTEVSLNGAEVRAELAASPALAALGGALLFAFLPLVWQQAIISEVYALNLLAVAGLVWSLSLQTDGAQPWLPGLLLGLAATTHLTSLLLLPAVFGLRPYRQWPKLALGLAAGLIPFLAIPLLARGHSPVIWGRPTTIEGWWWLVSARLYRPNLFSLSRQQWSQRLLAWIREPSIQLGLAMVFVVLASQRSASNLIRKRSMLLVATAGVYALYAFFYDAPDSLVLLLPAFLLLCVLTTTLHVKAGPLLLILPLLLVVLNFQRIDLSEGKGQPALVESVLGKAPSGAILYTAGDETTFTLWYHLYAEERRSDLIIVDEDLFAFTWYRETLQRRYPDLMHTEGDDLVGFRTHNSGHRPQCDVRLGPGTESAGIVCGDDNR